MTAVIVEAVLAGLGVLVVAFASAGALLAREPLAKLHFLAPVTSFGGPLILVAAIVFFGISLGSAALVVIGLVVSFSGPAVTIAIGRCLAREAGERIGRSPQ